MNLQKRTPYRNKEILKSAEGEECMMESPWCNYDPKTVSFCHLNYQWAGKGGRQKADDHAGFYGCSNCHDWYDGRPIKSDRMIFEVGLDKEFYAFRAMTRTIRRLLDKGVLK